MSKRKIEQWTPQERRRAAAAALVFGVFSGGLVLLSNVLANPWHEYLRIAALFFIGMALPKVLIVLDACSLGILFIAAFAVALAAVYGMHTSFVDAGLLSAGLLVYGSLPCMLLEVLDDEGEDN